MEYFNSNPQVGLAYAKYTSFRNDKELTRYRVHDRNASRNDLLFDKENLRVFKKVYNGYTDLDEKEKKILRKRY